MTPSNPAHSSLTASAALAMLGACVPALWASLRIVETSKALAFFAYTGAVLLILLPLTAAWRSPAARNAMQSRAATVGLALLLASPVLVALGYLLKVATHHRPLGAATYAILALAVLGVSVAVAARLTSLWLTSPPRKRAVLYACIAVGVALTAVSMRGQPLTHWLDAALLVATAVVVCRVPNPMQALRPALQTLAALLAYAWVFSAVVSFAVTDWGARLSANSPVVTGVVGWW